MNIFKKIKQERPWSSTSRFFIMFHWTLFAILWLTFLTISGDANADNHNITWHGHTVAQDQIPMVPGEELIELYEEEGPNYLYASSIMGADKIGNNMLRVKFRGGTVAHVELIQCWQIQLASGYIFGRNWRSSSMLDRVQPGLQVFTLTGGKIHEWPGCKIKTVTIQ
jgi:hypothetical protein